MADANVRQSGKEKSLERSNRQEITRSGSSPGIWSGHWISPGELMSLNPFSLMRRFTEDVDRMLSGAMSGHSSISNQPVPWMPAVDIRRRGDTMIVCAELPGVNQEDLTLEATDDGLVIQGERKHEHEEDRGGYHRLERRYGSFHRIIPLRKERSRNRRGRVSATECSRSKFQWRSNGSRLAGSK